MQVPGPGEVVQDAEFGWLVSAPIPVPTLGGIRCRLVIEGYLDDAAQEDYHRAIGAFLGLDRSILAEAAPWIYAYYRDAMEEVRSDDEWYVEIHGPQDVVEHVELTDNPLVTRGGDGHVYVSIEGECDWEPEHGLQIVLRDGITVTKVGPYDGHLTNSAAYDDESLDGVIYHRP